MKRGRRILLVLLACGVVAVVAAVVWPREREPEYQGKKLSEWLSGYQGPLTNGAPEKARQEKEDAVRHIGTNAVPWLVRWVAFEPPRWSQWIPTLLWRLPPTFLRRLPMRAIERRWRRGTALSDEADFGFSVLGPEARAAVPQLVKLMNRGATGRTQQNVMSALCCIGKDAYPALLAALEDQRCPWRSEAAWCIMLMYQNRQVDITSAVPGLLTEAFRNDQYVRAHPGVDTNPPFRFSYVWEDLPFFMPTLTNCLGHPSREVRAQAALFLGGCRSEARAAVPALLRALNDRDATVRAEATTALTRIAPEVLEGGHLGAGTNVEHEVGTNVEHRTVNIER